MPWNTPLDTDVKNKIMVSSYSSCVLLKAPSFVIFLQSITLYSIYILYHMNHHNSIVAGRPWQTYCMSSIIVCTLFQCTSQLILVMNCTSSPCIHGSCFDLQDGYLCHCLPGYNGTDCDHDMDDCASNPCAYGSCTDLVNGFSCACDPGFSGVTCGIGKCNKISIFSKFASCQRNQMII